MDITVNFSGGGARCTSFIGVIKALEESGFNIIATSGVSAGAFVGTMYSKSGKDVSYLEQNISKFKFSKLFDYKAIRRDRSIWSTANMHNILSEADNNQPCSIPTFVEVKDSIKGQNIIKEYEDDLYLLVAAMAYPYLLKPYTYKGETFEDGCYGLTVGSRFLKSKYPNLPNFYIATEKLSKDTKVPGVDYIIQGTSNSRPKILFYNPTGQINLGYKRAKEQLKSMSLEIPT